MELRPFLHIATFAMPAANAVLVVLMLLVTFAVTSFYAPNSALPDYQFFSVIGAVSTDQME